VISHSAFLGSFPVLFSPGIVPLFSNSTSGLCAFSPAVVIRVTDVVRKRTLRDYLNRLRIFVAPRRQYAKSGLHFLLACFASLREPVRVSVLPLPNILQPCRKS
jgi:hypothetical protein